jgi:PAS domain S-box-containing protein
MSGKLASVRLLLVEDDATDADLVRRSLRRASGLLARFDMDSVERAHDAAQHLARGGYDAVLLDLNLPDAAGLQSLATVQAAAGDTPIIVVTGYDDESLALEALHRGAQDYLLKSDIGSRSMARSIVYAIERRRIQESIQRSKAQLAEAQAIAQVGSFEWIVAADRIECSHELCRIHGRAPGEPTVCQLAEFISHVHAADRTRVEAALRGALADHAPFSIDYRIARPDGDVRALQMRGRVVLDHEGHAVRLLATCQDLTERQKLEEQVLLAGRMSAVGTLSGGVAHEINNPLAYVVSNIDFAFQEVGAFMAQVEPLVADERSRGVISLEPLVDRLHDVQEALGEARHGADRVRNIVRDLKTFSKAEEGKARVPLDVQTVLESSINLAWNEIRHRARLVESFEDAPQVLGNEARLGQVFVNLLVNAAQSIPEGQAESNQIMVVLRTVDAGTVCVEVRDSGAGISSEHLSRVFDPFFTTKQVGSAMGLGLSICYSVVHGLGGEIQVESTPGRGTTFRVLLPAAPGTVAEAGHAAPEEGGEHRGRVLIIDDEPMVVATLRRVLARHHDIATTTSAREALERLRAGQHFDVVLCDLMMPDMTGMALHEALEHDLPDVARRMIFITGGAFTPRGIDFLERVQNPRIEKPFDVRTLLQMVRAFVA